MENKGMKIESLDWNYNRFFDGKEMELIDIERKETKEQIHPYKYPFFCKSNSNKTKRIGWFRIYGYGIMFKDLKKWPMIFSERNGYSKHIIIGGWLIRLLKP